MKKDTLDEIGILLRTKVQNVESEMKRVILQGSDGKREFEQYKRYVCILDEFESFAEEGESE